MKNEEYRQRKYMLQVLSSMMQNILEADSIDFFDCNINTPVNEIPTTPGAPLEIQHTGYKSYWIDMMLFNKPKREKKQ